MQNYQNFIDELFRLNIGTVQYFVTNDQVLYDQLPQHYTADQLAIGERLPGHVGTFMSLDQYDQHQTENRYADTLVELQRRAITDVLLLEPAQITRLLSDAKDKCERLTQLLKNAMEYQKAWGYGTLDLLSAGFLKVNLLDAFTIKSRPEANPHDRFAHHLTDAIMYKRGMLSEFIKRIDTILQPAPAVLTDVTKEPEYDLWSVNNNDTYAFAKLKDLARYLPTVEPFTNRVELFFEISRVWEIEPGPMGMGMRMIPNPEVFNNRNEDGKAVDKNGQRVEEIAWGLDAENDEEKRIVRKLYFLRFYRTHRATFFNKSRPDVDQLISQYSTNRQTERGKRLQVEWVKREIDDRQQLINDWITANPDRYGNPEIKRQLLNAAVLIEQELEEMPAIKWGLFHRTLQLDPLASLWGLVEYKRFLELEENPILTITQRQKPDIDLLDAAPYCHTKDFRSDLGELCDKCKLGQFIEEGIQKQIIFQAQEQQDILTSAQFEDYCNKEIANAQQAMMQTNLDRKRHENDRRFEANIPNNTLYYIWNKERIKALIVLQQIAPDVSVSETVNNVSNSVESEESNGIDEFTDFFELKVQEQQGEIKRVNDYEERARKKLNDFRYELLSKVYPDLSRVRYIKTTIANHIELALHLLDNVANEYHAFELPPKYGQMKYADYVAWKGGKINKLLSEYNQLLATIEARIEYLSNKPTTSAAPASDKPEPQQRTTLIEWFSMPGKYPVVMGLLVEKGFCQPGTYLWIDESAGAKTAVATLIKYLHAQGFYVDNTRPSNKEIVTIAKQTFGIVIGIDTVKKAVSPTSKNHNLSFINPASTY